MEPEAIWFAAAVASMTATVVVVIAFHLTERMIMGINEELSTVKAALAEASSEIVNKITELEDQIVATESVDPDLLSEVKTLAANLAGIVPNVVEPVEEPVDVEVPVGEVPELPADTAPTA